MSVTAILQSALYRFGQAPDNQRFTDDFYSAINDAQYDFCTSRSWGFLRTSASLTMTTSVQYVALPTDFGKPYQMQGALKITSPTANSGDDIELMPYEQWLSSFYEDGTDTGEPTYAWIQGSNIYFSPTPDAAYVCNLIYYKVPASIDDSGDTITVPTHYQEGLRKMIFRRLQDAGYSSVQELQISDADIGRLIAQYAKDDAKKYGGLSFNLPSSDYTIRTT